MDVNVDELKKRIFNYRIKNNINQKDMAKKLNITEITLMKFFKKHVKDITVMKIEQKMNELEGEK